MTDELERIWKEAAVANRGIILEFAWRDSGNHEKPWWGQQVHRQLKTLPLDQHVQQCSITYPTDFRYNNMTLMFRPIGSHNAGETRRCVSLLDESSPEHYHAKEKKRRKAWSSFSIVRFADRSYHRTAIPYLWYWKPLPSINSDTAYTLLSLPMFVLYHYLFLPLPTASSSFSFKEHRNQLWANLRGLIKVYIGFLAANSLFQITPHSYIAGLYLILLIFCCGSFLILSWSRFCSLCCQWGKGNFFVDWQTTYDTRYQY
jgi:hypothetical protein